MEPTNNDDLFKRIVNEQEQQNKLSEEKLDQLWSKVESSPEDYQWLWKAASVVLLLLSVSLTALLFTSYSYNSALADLNNEMQKQNADSPAAENFESNQKPQVEYIENTVVEVVRDTVVRYVNKREIVYKDREVKIEDKELLDSLRRELKIREDMIAELNDTPQPVAIENPVNNIQVAFNEADETVAIERSNDKKFKFHLSLLNPR